MYRRYSQANENTVPVSQARRNRIKNILILLLAAAVVALTVVALPAIQRQNSAREMLIQRMQNEIANAVRLTTTLSRSAGANSAAILAQVRSNIYAISVMNDISISQDGPSGRLLQEDLLTSLQSGIDNYLAFLTTGMDTGEYQTNLQNTLNTLQELISALS